MEAFCVWPNVLYIIKRITPRRKLKLDFGMLNWETEHWSIGLNWNIFSISDWETLGIMKPHSQWTYLTPKSWFLNTIPYLKSKAHYRNVWFWGWSWKHTRQVWNNFLCEKTIKYSMNERDMSKWHRSQYEGTPTDQFKNNMNIKKQNYSSFYKIVICELIFIEISK